MPASLPLLRPLTFISADWASDKRGRKRSVHVATLRSDGRVLVRRVSPANFAGQKGGMWDLAGLLRLGKCAEPGGSVIIGVDVAIGVPCAYLTRWNGERVGAQSRTFVEWLESVPKLLLQKETKSSTRCYAGPVEWSVGDPFFNLTRNPEPKSGHPGVFAELRDRIGQDLLYRKLDQSTGAQPVWALNKGGSVGSGTRDFWLDLHHHLQPNRSFRVWPFERANEEPFPSGGITLVETYPALAYSVVIAPSLDDPPPRIVQIRKTDGRKKQNGGTIKVPNRRAEVCKRVKGTSWFKDVTWEDKEELDEAFGQACRNDDHFDSLMTVLAVVRSVIEQPDRLHGNLDPIAEGDMLLAGAVKCEAMEYENWITKYGGTE